MSNKIAYVVFLLVYVLCCGCSFTHTASGEDGIASADLVGEWRPLDHRGIAAYRTEYSSLKLDPKLILNQDGSFLLKEFPGTGFLESEPTRNLYDVSGTWNLIRADDDEPYLKMEASGTSVAWPIIRRSGTVTATAFWGDPDSDIFIAFSRRN